ncbi:hypothetical protein [Frigoribacterium faeni]|uniref:Uncharacterized protein n=1 Tax=Frigoribacterium faeni TaxID=145483 RepID=A0A7W3PIY0_9MICO|nr:hypothetical protein [Frigoribacterium faeni]MBA8813267.1 hypothetical protein [Frigoribacterium faeni]BFF14480.1 hypothetical protein GCM10025699_57830 [Microbacterium flavescens]GEK82919.1 hypothetical protein FFA01_12280 [Frigoribacterium faeni]
MLWSDVVTVTLGAFVGAGAAFATNLLVRHLESRRAEAAALNELVTEIHFRRVLHRIDPTPSPDAAATDPDYAAARRSISGLRGVVRAARRRTTPRSPALPVLNEMTLACNTFLDASDDEPDSYRLHLMQLHARLNASVRRLRSDRRAIADLEPGEARLGPTVAGLRAPTALLAPSDADGHAARSRSLAAMTTPNDARRQADARREAAAAGADPDATLTVAGAGSDAAPEKAGTAEQTDDERRQAAAPDPADSDVASDEYPAVPTHDGLTDDDRAL